MVKRRAVVIGMADYRDEKIASLKYTLSDASRIGGLLEHLPDGGFEVRHVLNRPANDVFETLDWAVNGMTKGDILFFYFAGHGVQQETTGQHLLLCNDARSSILKSRATNGAVPHSYLDDIARDLSCDCLFCFDACRSPVLAGKRNAVASMEGSRSLRDIGTARQKDNSRGVCWTIWSCADQQQAEERKNLGGGIFTIALTNTIRQRLKDTGGVVIEDAFMRDLVDNMHKNKDVDQTPCHSASPSGSPLIIMPQKASTTLKEKQKHLEDVESQYDDDELKSEIQYDIKQIDIATDSKPYIEKVYQKRLELWERAADKGWPEGQYLVGRCKEEGCGYTVDEFEATKWYRKAAEQGNVMAQNNLGICYKNGECVSKNMTEAVKWFRKAAEQGYAVAQCNLGRCYFFGAGIKKDSKEAVKWYRKAADQGNASAHRTIGLCYMHGEGVDKDMSEAVKWYRKAVRQGDYGAQYYLGACYDYGRGVVQNCGEAAQWYLKAAEHEDINAQNSLGTCYYNGRGVVQNFSEAVKWYRKAAEQGNAHAQYNLGICYKFDQGVEQNFSEAAQWYLKAAEQGHADAQCQLGCCYANGEGVEEDLSKAVKWSRKAAEQGHVDAQYRLGCCYAKGEGVEEDLSEAVKWYCKAAEQGDDEAQNRLGCCYFQGEGVKKDLSQAIKWYRKAAEQGHADAQFNLGCCYANGEGVEEDLSKAVKWSRKAAEQGHVEAQYQLACCYLKGEGVEEDLSKAVEWYRKAAEQGHVEAQYQLACCYLKGEGVEEDLSKTEKWCREAAEQGHPMGQLNLGLLYEYTGGVEENMSEAVKWYRKATEQGVVDAKNRLENLLALRQCSTHKNDEMVVSDLGLELVYIEPGNFIMGSIKLAVEQPVHKVTIQNGYWLGKYPVTQVEYRTIMCNNPSHFKGDNKPVETVSWNDAVRFCKKLTDQECKAERLPTGYEYRLPTEAEWEFAACGGSESMGYEYSGSDNVDSVAWYDENSAEKTHKVGSKSPNELGLFDMSGNVMEWCLDDWNESYEGAPNNGSNWGNGTNPRRLLRGGAWDYNNIYCRVATRIHNLPESAYFMMGFRVALARSLK